MRNITRRVSPLSDEGRTVRFLLRLPATLHAVLVQRAQRLGLSLNDYMNRRLAAPEPDMATAPLASLLVTQARRVVGDDGVAGIVLHGSWARGEARASSDIDALVVVDPAVPLTRALYRTWDAQPITWDGRAVDVHFVHLPGTAQPVHGLWCEAATDGRVLFDPSGRIGATLASLRHQIADGRLIRKRVHGQPYWTAA